MKVRPEKDVYAAAEPIPQTSLPTPSATPSALLLPHFTAALGLLASEGLPTSVDIQDASGLPTPILAACIATGRIAASCFLLLVFCFWGGRKERLHGPVLAN